MRNRALRGCLIVVFAVCVILLENIGSIAKKRVKAQPHAQQSQQQPETDKRGTLDAPFVVKPLRTEKNQQEAEEDARDKNEKRWNDRITIFVGVATAVILILQLVVFGWQAHRLKQTISTMKELGKEQREIGEAQVRAYVNIKSANIDFLWDAIVPRITFIAFNSGQSPARNFIWNVTLQYPGIPANRESALNENWLEQVGMDIPATSDAPPDGAFIPDMSVKQYIEGVAPGTTLTVIRTKIDFRFTDVFDRDWFGEAFFAGVMQREPAGLISQWTSQISAMAKPRDWDEVGKAKNS
jgi:hypothetical protein